MEITLIAAQAQNRVIGNLGELPWHIPEDLKRFKNLTSGYPVIMGRKTYESIMKRLNKPLPNRINIVLTSQKIKKEGVFFCSTPEEAISIAEKHNTKAFVIGGQTIYEQFISKANTLEITQINKTVEGDAFFPEIKEKEWNKLESEEHQNEQFKYSFTTYKRASQSIKTPPR